VQPVNASSGFVSDTLLWRNEKEEVTNQARLVHGQFFRCLNTDFASALLKYPEFFPGAEKAGGSEQTDVS
jgi:hypothetical protein